MPSNETDCIEEEDNMEDEEDEEEDEVDLNDISSNVGTVDELDSDHLDNDYQLNAAQSNRRRVTMERIPHYDKRRIWNISRL